MCIAPDMILVWPNYCYRALQTVELPTAAVWAKPVNGVSLGIAPGMQAYLLLHLA